MDFTVGLRSYWLAVRERKQANIKDLQTQLAYIRLHHGWDWEKSIYTLLNFLSQERNDLKKINKQIEEVSN